MNDPPSRRDALRLGAVGMVAAHSAGVRADAFSTRWDDPPAPRAFLTPADDFTDVSRGKPVPHTLEGQALIDARLTPETWRLEIDAEPEAALQKPLRLSDGTALTFDALLQLGRTHGVYFLKAMQCNNIDLPLGQGLWEGVPLRDVLNLCGKISDARRLFYWGFHNNDEAQMFRSSLAMNQVLDTPPGEMPPFLAFRLNGGPIPLERGGPVRMVVPWAHGFKSVKWLQKIVLTHSYAANDTYALANNDPESYLKTAAYFENRNEQSFPGDKPVVVRGTAMVGWPGLERVEYWLRPIADGSLELALDDPAWALADWKPATIDPPPTDWSDGLPPAVAPKQIWGFTPQGRPNEWPMRFSIAQWTLTMPALSPGGYELRVRTVDRNGFAQPEPRPSQRSGRNLIATKRVKIV